MTTNPSTEFTLGIDLAQSSIQATVAWSLHDLHHWRDLPTCSIEHHGHWLHAVEQLLAWLDHACPSQTCTRIVVESTGPLSERFARVCQAHALPRPAIVNPARIKAFAASMGTAHKNDVEDAAAIALFGVVHAPHPAAQRSAGEQKARDLVRLRRAYIGQRVANQNRLKATEDEFSRISLQRMIDLLNEEIDRTEQEIQDTLTEDPELSRQVQALQQMTGIGRVCASTLTAELGLLSRYKRNQLVACAGLFPRQHASGSSVWRAPRMSKRGGSEVRRVLYMCATSLFKHGGPLTGYIAKMLERGLKKMQIIGALMRKLLIIARAIMVNHGRFDLEKIGIQP